jgi:diguanylate cyclase (GGDEF)-like protein
VTSSSPPLTGDGPARPIASNLPLYVYTGGTIIVGLVALLWASLTFEVWPSISLVPDGGKEGIALGLLFWIVLGLLGGMRVERMHGYGVLTFHLPFIIAATALGGPVAGGWVAMISTLEIRELREVPWYGTLANHTGMALSAVLAGVVFDGVRNRALGAVTDQPQAAELLAILLATLVLAGLSSGLATGTRILRDHLSLREAVRLMDTSFRTTSASEVVMGWVLTVAYGTIGWWAAVVCATLVLVLWQAHDDRETARHDAMTGLLSRAGFDARLEEIVVRVRRGSGRAALLAIDLDGFKSVNDTYGHGAGDAVIKETGARLRDSIRLTDAAVRRGGDEFGVLLAGIADEAAAEQLATRIWQALCLPVTTEWGDIAVGASVGLIIIDPAGPVPTVDRLHAQADHEMYAAKMAGGGVRAAPTGSEPAPLSARSGAASKGTADVS